VDNHESNLCEFGYYEIEPAVGADHWFTQTMLVTQAHYQQFDLPEYAVLLAKSGNFPNQAFRYGNNTFALQFHPEVTAEIFRRWQDSDWAFYDRPGAQSRGEQDRLIDIADRIQGEWFHGFLDKVFGKPSPAI
jgi:GMP synthase (glutamine-hydrolysing)